MPLSQGSEEDIDRVGLLGEPVRRRLYELVAGSALPVDRDQAAKALSIGRSLAAFHLDRLVEGGLLEAEYHHRSGRRGPGAGRPAKFYRRAGESQVDITLPARRYALAATILADGLDRAESPSVRSSVENAAREAGRRLAAEAPGDGGRDVLLALLAAHGFEPEEAEGHILLRNCPFDALVDEHRDLTCGLNLTLLESVAATLPNASVTAVRRPRNGHCCVEFVPR